MAKKGLPKPPRGAPTTSDPRAIGGWKEQTNDSRDAHAYLWAGRIVHIDCETMVCSIRLDSGQGEYHDVPIPAPGGAGPRSWSGSMPERGTKVVVGWKKFGFRAFKPYIVQFLTPGIFMARDYEPFASVDPDEVPEILSQFPDLSDDPGINLNTVRLKNRKIYSGDWIASSSSGSDAILDRDASLTNRAGNELWLRDADQTAILQTINEFTNNAAGYYRRGLIKRNAFSFFPDLFPLDEKGNIPTTISKDSPSYPVLLSFGLIKEDGSKNFPDDPNNPFYPNVVTSDGQHVAYIVHGEHDQSFTDTSWCYIEDRVELRHISDGIMTVAEEGDGFQVDPPFPVFIEDVRGTVVGNDFHSEAGRPLYKHVLGMRIFNSIDQSTVSDGPKFDAIDTIQDLGIMDDVALARLFRVISPNSSNQYAFGITKEGKVLLYIPKTRVGTSEMKGKSVEASISGLVKAVIGADENSDNTSADLRLLGGLNIEIGRFRDGNSIHLKLHGKVRREYAGNDDNGLASEELYGGSISKTVSASEMAIIGGNSIEDIGAEKALKANSILQNAGPGGLKQVCAGDVGVTVLGKTQAQYAQLMTTTWVLGKTGMILSGVDSKTILSGTKTTTILAGAHVTTVTAGSMSSTVAAGSYSVNVGAGSFSATVGTGALSLTAGAGPISIISSLTNNLTAGVMNMLTAPMNKIGITSVGCAVAGIPGPPAPYLDPITGLPAMGIPTILIGP
jgi:hypothetical protein